MKLMSILACILSFTLTPALAAAGVTYTLTARDLTQPQRAPTVAQYFVQNDHVRIDASSGQNISVFKDRTIYLINHSSRSIDVMTNATLAQIAAKLDQSVSLAAQRAAQALPPQRAMAQQVADNLKAMRDRQNLPVPRDYRRTDRSETVDSHACRIWEEQEAGTKQLELCVAQISRLPGGADLLAGMKALSAYWQGSTVALGVSFGVAPWWTGIQSLGGVPLLVREFKQGHATSEVRFSGIQHGPQSAALFNVPDSYTTHLHPLGMP